MGYNDSPDDGRVRRLVFHEDAPCLLPGIVFQCTAGLRYEDTHTLGFVYRVKLTYSLVNRRQGGEAAPNEGSPRSLRTAAGLNRGPPDWIED